MSKNDILILLEKNIDESELYELEFSIFSSAIKIARLEKQLSEAKSFDFDSQRMKLTNHCLMR